MNLPQFQHPLWGQKRILELGCSVIPVHRNQGIDALSHRSPAHQQKGQKIANFMTMMIAF
ncbi:hypothetical protein A8B75_05935 [Sphingomonadales bacterium EhC05]|nr:hypothetical protein A8B75_05935 [Sphingomonadales bacterium EhC05]